jgi:hypothetical protein
MYWRRAELDPESGVRVFTALDAELAALVAADRATTAGDRSDGDPAAASGRRRRDQLAAQALVGLVTSAHRSQRPGRTEMLVVVDYDTIVNDLHDHSICEYIDGTELPAATARRLACDAGIYPVVLGADSVALDMGRSRRHPPPSSRPRGRVAARPRPDHTGTHRTLGRWHPDRSQPTRPHLSQRCRPGTTREATIHPLRDGTDRRTGGLTVHAVTSTRRGRGVTQQPRQRRR